tara:strand:- start:1709 stop:1849 length:141 start_codon:yes stop_codon:yes gene_type:complete
MTWEDVLKENTQTLEKIAKELDKAVEMHASQAKRIRQYIKELKEKK